MTHLLGVLFGVLLGVLLGVRSVRVGCLFNPLPPPPPTRRLVLTLRMLFMLFGLLALFSSLLSPETNFSAPCSLMNCRISRTQK